MSTSYQIDDPTGTYFLTFRVIDWVDIFSRKIYRDILIDSFDFCRNEKGLQIWSFVIMTNHVHSILSAKKQNLPDLVREFKRFTATKILKTIPLVYESRAEWMLKRFEFSAKRNIRNSQYQFWNHDNHAEPIFSNSFLIQKMNYIHLNPVRAGFVDKADDWMYSSARNYSDRTTLLDIDFYDGSG
ncbi:MAG: transposase [Saprospiraceae bacterium]